MKQRVNIAKTANLYPLLFMDGLRGLTALYVSICHARWLLWEGYRNGFLKHPEQYTIFHKISMYFFLGIFRYGYEAVIFFFVLSGFVIHLRYARYLYTDRITATFDIVSFFKRRTLRIYPPLIFAMFLTLICDTIGSCLDKSAYSHAMTFSWINHNIHPSDTILAALGNLFFFTNTFIVWGSNIPLWSIRYEWWFYVLYPLFWFFSKKSISIATFIMASLFALTFKSYFWPLLLFRDIFSMMVIWWLGALLADIYVGRIKIHFSSLSWLVLLCPFLLLRPYQHRITDLLWGVGFVGCISSCLFLQERHIKLTGLTIFRRLGDMSYTLYLVHFPVYMLLRSWLLTRNHGQSLPMHFGWVLLGITISVSIAYIAHFFVERPYARTKNYT